jgi:1-phosphofructokinase family hexose kinase
VILCVAASPCVDTLFSVSRITRGAIHRPSAFLKLAGGKGINVARAASALGAHVHVVGLVAGHSGRWIEAALSSESIPATLVWAPGDTRRCLTVAERDYPGGVLTEFYENATPVNESSWETFEEVTIHQAEGAAWLAISGSLPAGAPDQGYARIATRARKSSIAVALDAGGTAGEKAIQSGVRLVKVNADEASTLVGQPIDSVPGALEAATELRDRLSAANAMAVVTLGIAGAVMVGPGRERRRAHLDIQGPYPVGSGDAFLAGMIVSLGRNADPLESLVLALGTAAANSELAGPGRLIRERAEQLSLRVQIEEDD